MKWDKNSVAAKLREEDLYDSERSIEHGTQFVLVDNTKVNCYDTGKVNGLRLAHHSSIDTG